MSSGIRLRKRGLPPASSSDWRLQIPEARRRRLRVWFWTGAVLTFVILVVGGITRLTESGLSIVDWKPVTGIVPPLTEAQWWEAFRRYQHFPEYQTLRHGMTLADFRFIFLWEYVHRLAARLIGMVFLVPFAFFWVRGYFNRPLLWRVLVLFGLGALQGFMGWFMVSSGLVDDPRVSHYRLAAHLSIALSVLALCVWLAREMGCVPARAPENAAGQRPPVGDVYALGGLLLMQILWGAFVAGLDAGTIFNTFPRMGGGLVPPGAWVVRPAWRNLVENPATVQWVHRLLGSCLALAAIAVHLRQRRAGVGGTSERLSALFAALVVAQYGLGVLTLLHSVPVALGAVHQATAVIILGTWLTWLHVVRTQRRRLHGAPVEAATAHPAPGSGDLAFNPREAPACGPGADGARR